MYSELRRIVYRFHVENMSLLLLFYYSDIIIILILIITIIIILITTIIIRYVYVFSGSSPNLLYNTNWNYVIFLISFDFLYFHVIFEGWFALIVTARQQQYVFYKRELHPVQKWAEAIQERLLEK